MTNLLRAYAGFPGVMHVRIVRDRGSGQSRGFGFVVSTIMQIPFAYL